MKILNFLLSLGLCLSLILFAGEGLALAKLPKNYSEFKTRYQTEGRTIEGAFKLHMEAIFCYIDPKTRKEASKMLRYSMHQTQPIEQNNNLAIFIRRMKDPETNFIFRGVCAGTSVQNSYAMDPDNFSINFAGSKQQEADYITLYVQNSGADSRTLIGMRNYDGLWYTFNNSSLYVMVREPQSMKDQKRFSHDADYDGKPVPPRENNSPNGYGQPVDINSLMPAPLGNTSSGQNSSRSNKNYHNNYNSYNNYNNNNYNYNNNKYNNNYNNTNDIVEKTLNKVINSLPRTNNQYNRY